MKKITILSVFTAFAAMTIFGQTQTKELTGNMYIEIDKANFENVSGGCEIKDGHFLFFNEGTGSNWDSQRANLCDNGARNRYIKKLANNKTMSIKVKNLNSFAVSFKSTGSGSSKSLSYVIKDLTDLSVADVSGSFSATTGCISTSPVSTASPGHEYQIIFTSVGTDNYISKLDLASTGGTAPNATSGSFQVGGSFDNFYPVVFVDTQWDKNEPTLLELNRYDTHTDSQWRGSMDARFVIHVTHWGNGSAHIDAEIYQYNNMGEPTPFIADWADVSAANGEKKFVIWLRGGASTYNFKSNGGQTPVVYDDEANSLPFHNVEGEYSESATDYTSKTEVAERVNSAGTNLSQNLWVFGEVNYFKGKVGIGTTEPQEKLDVNGSIFIPYGESFWIGANVDDKVRKLRMHFNNSNLAGAYIDYQPTLQFRSGTDNVMLLDSLGRLGIGTSNPQYMLDVKGEIRATKMRVENISNFPDFVFAKDYSLRPLGEVKTFIAENGHLPEIPTAAEVEKNGMSIDEMQVKLLQKVEELTLYMIQQQEKIDVLNKEISILKSQK